mgnify:CR=1 FL=1
MENHSMTKGKIILLPFPFDDISEGIGGAGFSYAEGSGEQIKKIISFKMMYTPLPGRCPRLFCLPPSGLKKR